MESSNKIEPFILDSILHYYYRESIKEGYDPDMLSFQDICDELSPGMGINLMSHYYNKLVEDGYFTNTSSEHSSDSSIPYIFSGLISTKGIDFIMKNGYTEQKNIGELQRRVLDNTLLKFKFDIAAFIISIIALSISIVNFIWK